MLQAEDTYYRVSEQKQLEDALTSCEIPPPYKSETPKSFFDMINGPLATQKPRTSYKNNAPAPTYVALSNDETDSYGEAVAPVISSNDYEEDN